MVLIDYSRDSLLTPFGLATLKDRYLLPSETSPQEAFARAAGAFADDEEHAQRIYDYASKLWFMFSTPILSNGGTQRGLPISCYLNYVPDSRSGITEHYTENAWLASLGGGIGGYWGDIRSNGTSTSTGSRSTGSIPFIHVVDAEMLAFSQGTTRRGSYAAYQDISHPEIEEFILMRKPTGGDIHRKCLNLHHGINITDEFMEAVKHGRAFPLVDPHSKEVVKTINPRTLWRLILETRVSTGEPYLHFIDTTGRGLPASQRELGLRVRQSNLCSEITLPTSEDRSAVCCLSSVNLEKFNDWRECDDFIPDIVRFLDNVLTRFIQESPPELAKAAYSASQERSIGLGAMGFHSYLQKLMIPFESIPAITVNKIIFQHIKEQAESATRQLARERGEPPDSLNSGVRNLHLMAIAPNASSSIICGGTSPSIEPLRANTFTQKTMSGSFQVRNKYLEEALDKLGKNTPEVWSSITQHRGSVQHLEFFDEWTKKIFKTAIEIDQNWVIQHAADRQKFICQSQSVNLFFPADVDAKTLHSIHFKAWEKGLKTLYYLRSETISRAELVGQKVERSVRQEFKNDSGDSDCIACEG